MNRNDYLAAVTAELTHLTSAERDAVRGELAAHIEDHAEALCGLGYAADEAETRATEQMGDPAQVGRDIAKLYRPFWLWVERAALALIVFLVIELLGSVMLYNAWNSVSARVCTPDDATAIRLDERMEVGDDVVRLYGISGYRPGEACEVRLWMTAYDRSFFGIVHQNIWSWMKFRAGESAEDPYLGSDGWSTRGVSYHNVKLALAPENTSVTLRYERFGQVYERVIDLTEVSG